MGMVAKLDSRSFSRLIVPGSSLFGIEWDRAKSRQTSSPAIGPQGACRGLETYRKTYTRLPESLKALGPAGKNHPKAEAAGLVDEGPCRGT